jgi:regulator of protease activity HflC (stomatin/prohibitin superfamily)
MLKLSGVLSIVVGLFVLLAMAGSFYTIDEGERGVKTRYGKVVGAVEPGLGFKAPFIENVDSFSVRTTKTGYENISALTNDQQKVSVDVVVNYQVDPAAVVEIYSTLGKNYAERVINPAILDATKGIFGHYTAQRSVHERAAMADEMTEQLKVELAKYGMLIHQVQIQDVDFSATYLHSIEARMEAEIAVQKKDQERQKEAISAEIKRIQADATAYDTLAQAKAEAESIDIRGKALKDNPSLVSLIQAEKWDGKLPTTMPPNATVPFLNLGGK